MKAWLSQRLSSVAFAALIASGCATTASNPKDPFEGFNRAMFAVNEGVDVAFVKPLAQGYDTVAPLPVKVFVGNFFGNLWDVWTALNNLLQGKLGDAVSDVGRVLVNSTVGIGAAFDVAGEMVLTKHSEEFGQTLAVSGGPVAAAMGFALNLDDEKTLDLSWVVRNAAYCEFLFSRGRFSLMTCNAVPHLVDPHLLTFI